MGKKIWRIISTLLIVIVLVMLAAVFFQRITGREPALFGYRLNYIRTGSMEPVIESGDVILCKNVSADEVAKGDIITYRNDGRMTMLPEGETVCHRVVEEPRTENGVIYLVTCGDNNNGVKDPEITGDQVIGRYVRKLTLMTLFYKVFLTKWGFLIIIIPLALLLVVELYRITHSKDEDGGASSDNTDHTDVKDLTGEADETV